MVEDLDPELVLGTPLCSPPWSGDSGPALLLQPDEGQLLRHRREGVLAVLLRLVVPMLEGEDIIEIEKKTQRRKITDLFEMTYFGDG